MTQPLPKLTLERAEENLRRLHGEKGVKKFHALFHEGMNFDDAYCFAVLWQYEKEETKT